MRGAPQVLEERRFQNFREGTFTTVSSSVYDVSSPFFPEYVMELPDSNLADRQLMVAGANSAQESLKELTYTDRKAIVQAAADQFETTESELEYFIKMTGMPRQSIEFKLDVLEQMFEAVVEAIDTRYGDEGSRLGREIIPGRKEYYWPREAPSTAFYPANDPSVAPHILLHAVLTGNAVISRPSSEEAYSALKLAELLTTNGYPADALNVLLYDSTSGSNQGHRRALINEAAVTIAFGDDETITEFEQAANGSSPTKVVGFGEGRANAYVFDDADVEAAAESIVEGMVRWPIGCNATKAVRVDPAVYDEFKAALIDRLSSLTLGNPLAEETDIGYVSPETVTFVEDRVTQRVVATSSDELVYPRSNLSDLNERLTLGVTFQGEKPIQMQPVVVETDTEQSEFLQEEYPGYVLGLSPVEEQGLLGRLNQAYYSQGRIPITMAFYTENPPVHPEVIGRTRAHQKFVNDTTINVDPFLRHQGIDLVAELTEVESVTVEQRTQPWLTRVFRGGLL